MTPRIALVVPREHSGTRLDRFLAVALSGGDRAPSRSELKRWIGLGRVSVDGVLRGAADKVSAGARVEVTPEPPAHTDALPEEGIAFEVLRIDDDVVVIHKPAGLVVHPARGHATGTLVNGLLALGAFKAFEQDGGAGGDASAGDRDEDANLRPGIVHRLDKGTSGVMVVARNAAARERLKTQFAEHSVDREYEALAVGEVVAQVIATLHGRHPKDRLRFTSQVREGKRAVTHVRVLERIDFAGGGATHVACHLETGRTHQIRMHLAESGAPILGDAVYGRPPRNPALRAIGAELGHQALHARVLGFTHPSSGERLRFEVAPPDDFRLALLAVRALGAGRAKG